MKRFVIFAVFICLWVETEGWSDNRVRKFKKGFLFGVSTSAYQVEGAENVDGKGESIWNTLSSTHPELFTGDQEAPDSYCLYRRDVEMLRELGVDHYRFSIAWSRVLPTGFSSTINEKGLEYYENLIDELLKYNIEPMVTLYHYDLPQKIQDLGGWANPLITDWFVDYSRIIFDRFAKKVKYWITINQPSYICLNGYGDLKDAPALNSKGVGDYLCIKHTLVAHAKVYRLYEKKYKKNYKGSVGISLALDWIDPANNETENKAAAEEYRTFTIDLYMNPIWSKYGDFPEAVKSKIAKKSKEQGLPRSKLPKLSTEEIKLLKGSSDFLGINHYTTFLVSRPKTRGDVPSFQDDADVELSLSDKWKQSRSHWLKSAPYGIYKLCLYLNKVYDYPIIFITENGWSTDVGLEDNDRVENIREYLKALLYAVEDGTNVLGYTVWSLMDNLEWTSGNDERFGLYEVDYTTPEKTRTARQSALVYRHIIESRLIDDWTPENLNIGISERKKNVNTEL